jgi:NDP-sugar pyrophosphorylase family protein
MEHLVCWLSKSGLTQIVICVGYKRSQIQRWFQRGRKWGVNISYAVETSPLGTGGALRNAQEAVEARSVFVLNGDTFADVDLLAMMKFHQRKDALATVALAKVNNVSRYGIVEIDPEARITGFKEKVALDDSSGRCGGGLINAGVYLFNMEVLKKIPPARQISLEQEVFPGLLRDRLFGFQTDGYFIDIGIPEDLHRASSEMPRGLFE